MISENYRLRLQQMLTAKKAMIAFNVQNIYHLDALETIADELDAPVIAQISAKYLSILDRFHGLANVVNRYQRERVFFHLDHCCDNETIIASVQAGFAGVMFDGSHLPLKENIRRTNELYSVCKRSGSLIEVELGAIAGVEDGYGKEDGSYYCEDELTIFCRDARFDLLAVAIGNAHGEYKTTEGVRIELLGNAREICGEVPMVLHGGTGLPDEMVYQAIGYGVAKINFSTALKLVTHRAIARYQLNTAAHDEIRFAATVTADCGEFFRSIINKFTL